MLDVQQSKMVSNEVNNQGANAVTKAAAVPNVAAPNLSTTDQQQTASQGQTSNRAPDDAIASYVFQRQSETDYQPYPKRWFGGDDPALIESNGQTDTQELEAGFNALALEPEGFASTKKIWGVEDKHSEDSKALFITDSHQWGRDSTWSSAPGVANSSVENGGLSEHAVSQPILVKRGSNAYGADGTLISPRSTDTVGIGMKMAEYVLNNSPSSKDNLDSRSIHSRLLREHDKVAVQSSRKVEKDPSNVVHTAANGLANGFGPPDDSMDPSKLFNRAPGIPHQVDESAAILANNNKSVIDGIMMPGVGHQPPFGDFGSDQLGTGPITGIDGLQSFGNSDYIGHHMPSSTDSPNLIDAYTNNMYQRNAGTAGQANNQMSMLSNQPPHMNMPAQQPQNLGPNGAAVTIGHPTAAPTANNNIFTAATQGAQNPYFSDPFMSHMLAAGGAGPAAMAMSQYYGFPPAWNMYPGILPNATTPNQSGHHTSMQQQQVRGTNNPLNSSNRPLSPSSVQNSNDHNSANQLAAIQAQAASQTGFPMIPLPGAPSGFYDQNSLSALAAAGRGLPNAMHRILPQMNMLQTQAALNNGGVRMLPNHSPNQNAPAQTAANPIFASNGSNTGIFSTNGHNANQPLGPQQMGFHNPTLGSIGASIQSAMGNNAIGGNNSPRRDSMDGRSSNAMGLGSGVFPTMINDSNIGAFSRHMAGGTMGNANSSGKANVGMNNNLANAAFYGMNMNSPGPIGLGIPGQSMTPPPINSMDASMNGFANALTGPNSSLYMNGMRLVNAGSENKYMTRNGLINQNAAAFAAAAASMSNFNNGSSAVIGNANAGIHFNHANGLQSVNSTANNNYSNNANNRNSAQRTRSVEKNVGRSTLLEDFRNSRLPNLALRDLNDHIVEFSQDQHGSRFIQQKLERATDDEKQLVFNEIIGQAYQLMTDVFGNYVIQKFFEFGTPQQKQALAQTIRGNVLNLALQMYGCRVIQKALESIPSDQQKDIVKELDGHVLKCVKDQNGNHVVQKCIECIEPSALQFIINAFQGQVVALSTHPYGCRVIQRILEHCNPEQTSCILQELHQNTEQLVQDQYGNYVVQHVLEHGRPEDKTKIILMVRGKVLTLSQHKFASNVVERCITQAMRSERAMLIEEVCNYNDNALYTMMKDQYANYVVQKMIEVADSQQRKALLLRIRPHMNSLRRFTYGKHILAKLEKYMNTSSKSATSSIANGIAVSIAPNMPTDGSMVGAATSPSVGTVVTNGTSAPQQQQSQIDEKSK